jgi:cation diffusion facilitator family transporter
MGYADVDNEARSQNCLVDTQELAERPGCGPDDPSHHRIDPDEASGPRLLAALVLNLIIPLVQAAGGLWAGSVALISDAAHNFSDFTALLIAYVAYRIGRKGASPRNTFGYRRAEVMAALLNAAILIGAAFYIVYEAVGRFGNPQAINGLLVMGIAGIGIAGNGLSAWLLHRDAKHSLNVRGAFLHMVGDLLTSVAVAVSGLVLFFKPWYWLDPVLSVVIVLFILKNCWGILRDASAILMNATPRGLDIHRVKETIEQIPGVCAVHYLHAWNVSSSSIAFSCHVVVADQPVSGTEALAETVRHTLSRGFGIDHPILQFETAACGNGSMLCEISCGDRESST